jgi:hypothetical protein
MSKFLPSIETIISTAIFGIGVAFLLVVIASKMNAIWSNCLLASAWLIFVASCSFRFDPVSTLPLIPRVLWTMLFAAAIGLLLYYLLWTHPKSAPSAQPSATAEFHQRQDLFAKKISELNDGCNQLRQIPARLAVLAVNYAGLPLREEQAEQNEALIAAIKEKQKSIEKEIGTYTETIEKLHSIYRNLTLETDSAAIETWIAVVQVGLDDIKQTLSGYSAMLYVVETGNENTKKSLAERDAKIRQINEDFEKQVEKINREFERKVEKLENAKQPSLTPDKEEPKH